MKMELMYISPQLKIIFPQTNYKLLSSIIFHYQLLQLHLSISVMIILRGEMSIILFDYLSNMTTQLQSLR